MLEPNAVVEIDNARGVIYVHDSRTGKTIIRICHLPTPIPQRYGLIDITVGVGSSYSPPVLEECEKTDAVLVIGHGDTQIAGQHPVEIRRDL